MELTEGKIKVVAVIATCNRPVLLVERAVTSILKQTRLPDYLIIIDDSKDGLPDSTRFSIQQMMVENITLCIEKNSRSPGASGAWNSAIILAGRLCNKIEDTYIAILDDDDEWVDSHLSTCISYAPGNDMVISGLLRKEGRKITPCAIPTTLDAQSLLVGNPNIQGSNLFVRLLTMYEAGMFDEHLLSTTDRDICIRLCELSPAVISTHEHTVIHYADTSRNRLSSPGSKKKRQGLSAFWDKYSGRMTEGEKELFHQRARNLFNVTISSKKGKKNNAAFTGAPTCEPFVLVVGIISDSAKQIAPLLQDIRGLIGEGYIESIKLVVLHNGGCGESIKRSLKAVGCNGLETLFLDEAYQAKSADQGCFGSSFVKGKGRLPIGKARTVLQKCLASVVEDNIEAFVWILDDDMRLEGKVKNYLPWLPVFRQQGVDVVLGSYEGGSPNPAANAIRIQLMDLVHNLTCLNMQHDNDELEDKEDKNGYLRDLYPDYYYDLSRKHFGHLEMPFWLEARRHGETVAQVKERLFQNIDNILTGKALFRPLVVANLLADPLAEAIDSANRGGTTFILNHEVLSRTPNVVIEIDGEESRRSDMLWALINRYYYGFSVKLVQFPVLHQRNVGAVAELDLEKTVAEIRGASVYAALSEFLSQTPGNSFEFSDGQVTDICNKVIKYTEQRLLLYKLNFYRINGLIKVIKTQSHNENITKFLEKVARWASQENFIELEKEGQRMDEDTIRTFLISLPSQITDYARSPKPTLKDL